MAEQRAGESVRQSRGTIRRRSLIAGAAELSAEIAANQVSQPVAAGGTDKNALIIGQPNTETYSGTTLI